MQNNDNQVSSDIKNEQSENPIDTDKIDIVAKRILKKYRKAFEELTN